MARRERTEMGLRRADGSPASSQGRHPGTKAGSVGLAFWFPKQKPQAPALFSPCLPFAPLSYISGFRLKVHLNVTHMHMSMHVCAYTPTL